METLLMSAEERKRMVILTDVKSGRISLAQGARDLGICYRQAKRIWQRFQKEGAAGLVHRRRGKPSLRRKPAKVREQVLARYRQRYPDFGPTLAAEKLGLEGLPIDHETLRRWLLSDGQWTVRRRGRRHRAWRERRERFGEMVQLDGSHHDWFEGRRAKAVLMVMVDDATNRTVARFAEEETTEAAYEALAQWVKAHGIPASLYVDRDSIYRCERRATVAEEIAQAEPQTQFGRAMGQLGVELILANSPQAKGRVERRNGLLQDRLVKEMRLAGISDLEAANRFLEEKYLAKLNEQFTVGARSEADAHRPAPKDWAEALSWEEERVVNKDWTVACEGRWYQIGAEHENLSLVNRKVTVRRLRCGSRQLLYEGRRLSWKELPERPKRAKEPRRVGRTEAVKVAAGHPWRKDRMGVGREFWKQEKARGAVVRRRNRQAAAASGLTSLRSSDLQRRRPGGTDKKH